MATPKGFFNKLSKLFRSGPRSKRVGKTARGADTAIAAARNNGVSLVQKSQSPSFANVTGNVYNITERLMRYQDFQEMEYTPELASALDIYADEAVAGDEKDQIFHVFAPNEAIKIALEDLFFNVMNIEFNLRGWVRNLCKYGDFFALNEIDPEQGIIRVVPMPVNEIEREEGFDPTDPLMYKFRWVSYGNRELDCWQVTHIRLLGNDQFLPYGMSVIEAARRIWRQLILIEDAMLTYRIVRAPERRVFYVDVGNTPPEDVPLVVEETKRNIRTAPVVDRTTGRADLRYNPVSIEEDYWIAVRGQDTGTKIDTLQGGQNAAAVEDVQYIQKKLFAALKIPKAYLGYDEALCLAGHQRVMLLDGTQPTIADLADRFAKNPNTEAWTYSCDSAGKFKPGKILKAWETKRVYHMLRVTLDSGKTIDCTENHPFMLIDGSYKRADALVAGESLMPVHSRRSSKAAGDLLGRDFAAAFLKQNHKVASVEILMFDEAQPVYDVEVEEWHNFRAAEDVILHNSSKATLAQEDIRFSRTISVIQKTVLAELQRLAIMHLYCLGFPEEELQDFSIRLSNPSTVAQQQKLELLRAKAEIAGSFPEGTVDRAWIRKEVLNFTDEHIAKIDELRLQERRIDAAVEAAGQAPEGSAEGGGAGGGDLFGGSSDLGGEDLSTPEEPETQPSETEPAEEPETDLSAAAEPDALAEPDVALLTSGDQPDVQSKAKRRAARKRHNGASALVTPDFASMISRSVKDDPFDSHWLKNAGKNPLAEESIKKHGLSSDMIKLLQKIPRRTKGVI